MARELIRRQPIGTAVYPFDRLFSGLLSRDPLFSGITVSPVFEENGLEIDISEDEENVLVRASLPGFKREDIAVDVHEGVLTISGTLEEESGETRERFHRRERRQGSVSRRVPLPVSVDEDGAQATLNNGVLELRLPKNGTAGPRRIAIN